MQQLGDAEWEVKWCFPSNLISFCSVLECVDQPCGLPGPALLLLAALLCRFRNLHDAYVLAAALEALEHPLHSTAGLQP